MIASDLAAAIAFAGIAFAHSPILLIVLAGITSVAEAPFGPASSAFLVMLVPESERARATAARASGAAIGVVFGGMVGGLVVAALGGTVAFLVNSASFVLSALLLVSIRGSYRAAPSDDASHAGVWAGVRLIAREPALRLVLAANGAALVGYGMINVAEFPLFAQLGSGAKGFGIATAGFGVGQFVGARLGRRADGPRGEKHALLLGWLVGGMTLFVCGVSPSTISVIVLFSISGVGSSLAGVATTLVLQRRAPDAVRARVFAASGSVNIGAIVVAMIVGGALVGPLGPVALCIVCGTVTLLALIPSWFVPPRGRLPWKPRGARAPESTTRGSRWLLAS
jgi:MFS family permease